MVTRARIGRRPLVPIIEDTGLTLYMRVNGLEAIVLFDSGSTGDSVSPEFARVAGIRTFELENPTALQLGCTGSRSRISHGTHTTITTGPVTVDTYLDVVNLDRYDVVLGTPFMRRNSVLLDFGRSVVVCQGHDFAALSPQEEDAGARHGRPQNEDDTLEKHRKSIIREYEDLFQPVPPVLPPFREINHTIPLIDENIQYKYRLPKCPEALKAQLKMKIDRYTHAGWWIPAQVSQAAPLLCVYK
ncbi:hypothetical protein C2E23DRAFT_733715, partial [Lenzites betulinus]